MALMELESHGSAPIHCMSLLLTWSLFLSPIFAYSPLHFSRSPRRHGFLVQTGRSSDITRRSTSVDDDEDDNWLNASDNDAPSFFASRSAIPQFIDAYLEKEREARGDVRPNIYTHMIGVPMTECHQLQIELESVQRAILYYCPSLIHACIVPTMSRMPLLFVDASREPAGSVTLELHKMVRTVVRKHCYVKHQEVQTLSNQINDDIRFSGVNEQGYTPLTMTFHKLQIDGEGNDALFTVADRDVNGGLVRLQAMARDLQDAIIARGWKCQFPPSDVQGMKEKGEPATTGDTGDQILPRIALMRLPPKFESFLRPLTDDDDRHLSQDGGNGISPVFWIKWEKDVMASNVRLREVGIYPRRPGFSGLDEQTFYIPHETVKLPEGNELLSQQEKVHRDYNEQRIKESERSLEELESGEISPDGDFVDPSLSSDRKMLESIFGIDSGTSDNVFPQSYMVDDQDKQVTVGQDLDSENSISDKAEIAAKSEPQDDIPERDDTVQQRIRTIVENRPSQQQRGISPKTADFAAIDRNPVFQAYRNGTLLASKATRNGLDASATSAGPCEFPSNEILRGFWKVVRSPLEPTSSDDMAALDESRSDNFVFRVDGTVAGGPVIDQDTNNKACGSTWSLLESDTLRIRLVIPPKKTRIMVWEGQIMKEEESSVNSVSILDAATFGKILQNPQDQEGLKCVGQAWIEDAVTKRNREDLGAFILRKVNTSNNPADFTITIPMSVRNQD